VACASRGSTKRRRIRHPETVLDSWFMAGPFQSCFGKDSLEKVFVPVEPEEEGQPTIINPGNAVNSKRSKKGAGRGLTGRELIAPSSSSNEIGEREMGQVGLNGPRSRERERGTVER